VPIKISLENFNINPQRVPQEVEEKYLSLSKRSKRQMDRIYGSAYNFLAVLYQLWFVERLEKSEIAAKLSVKPPVVHIKLYDLSWHYSNDWEENKALFIKETDEFNTVIPVAKVEANKLNIDSIEHKKLKKALSAPVQIKATTYLKCGIKSQEEYIRILYYFIFIKKYSVKQLIPIFNQSHGTIQAQLRNLELNLEHGEGIANKKERKSQNYEKSIRAGKKTRAKYQLENMSMGSKNQDYVRVQLSNFIYDYFNSKRYEAVIGMSNTGILDSLEIDIPIVIFDVKEDQIYRFAVEYNGSYFHSATRDESKKELAERKGWHYLTVVEASNDRFSNDSRLLDSEVHKLCQKMKNIVLLGIN
jgi:hypothetical protein